MKINFNTTHKASWGDLQSKVSEGLCSFLKKEKDFFVNIDYERSPKQLKGYWRLCGLLAPYLQSEYQEIFSKEMVSDLVKSSCSYTMKAGKQEIVKSLKSVTKEEMGFFIEKLYQICEYYKVQDYELLPSEVREMEQFFNN